jgi:hypothetical protein
MMTVYDLSRMIDTVSGLQSHREGIFWTGLRSQAHPVRQVRLCRSHIESPIEKLQNRLNSSETRTHCIKCSKLHPEKEDKPRGKLRSLLREKDESSIPLAVSTWHSSKSLSEFLEWCPLCKATTLTSICNARVLVIVGLRCEIFCKSGEDVLGPDAIGSRRRKEKLA